jgi:hypothetical protein
VLQKIARLFADTFFSMFSAMLLSGSNIRPIALKGLDI